MRKPQAFSFLIDPDQPTKERDCFTCFHCQRIVEVEPMADPSAAGGTCNHCHRLICPACVNLERSRGGFACTPWEETMRRMAARQDALRSYGL